MVTKAELKILEKAFAAEISNTYFQSKSKLAKKLVEDELLQEVESKKMTCFGIMTIKHLALTFAGHFIYCDSCAERENNG